MFSPSLVFVTCIGASSLVILASLSRLLGLLIQPSGGIGRLLAKQPLTLSSVFMAALVLHHWIPSHQIVVEMDTSNYDFTGILSILGDDREFHPVAFQSRTLMASELNYDMHNKELLAIFDCFTLWHHYLDGPPLTVDVVMDHKTLEYFASTKVLTHGQVD
jgi:hypothetical protein